MQRHNLCPTFNPGKRFMSGFSKFNTQVGSPSRNANEASIAKSSSFKSLVPVPPAKSPYADNHKGENCNQTSVRTVVEGGVVTHIVVTCSCGEVIEIECSYPGRGT